MKAALPNLAMATIEELRIRSRDISGLYERGGAGTAAVASVTWSAHLLALWRGGRGRDPDRCLHALSYLLIK